MTSAVRGSLQELYVEKCATHKCKPDAIVARVLEGKNNSEVTELDFSSNYLGSVGLRALFEALHGCPRLQTLSFEANYLKSEAIPPLVALVNSLPVCSTINLSKNTTLGFTAANHLMNLIKSHHQILQLDVSDTGISKGTQDQIQALLEENRSAAAKLGRPSTPPSTHLITAPNASPDYTPPAHAYHPPQGQYKFTRPRSPPSAVVTTSPHSSPTRNSISESPYGFVDPMYSSDLHQSYHQFMSDPSMGFNGTSTGSLLPSRDSSYLPTYDHKPSKGSSTSLIPHPSHHSSTPAMHTSTNLAPTRDMIPPPTNPTPQQNSFTRQSENYSTDDSFSGKQQQQEIMKGKTPVIQHEERTLQTAAKLTEKCSGKRDNFRSRHAKGLELLEQFDTNSSWPYSTSYSTKQLIDEVHLAVPYEEVESFQNQTNVNYGTTAIHNMFDEVSDFHSAKRKITSLVEELKKMSKACAPGTENLAEVVSQLYDLLHGETAAIDQIREHLSHTDHKVPALLAEADQIDNAREAAVREESMEKAEGCHDNSLRALEEVLDLILSRLNITAKGTTTHTIERLADIEEYFKKLISPLQPHCDDLIGRINNDCQALDSRRMEEQRKLEEATNAHRHYQRRAKEFFQENTMKHNSLWSEIQTQYDKLKQYGEERYAEIEAWIQATEKHEKEKAECSQVNIAIDKHKKTLSDMMDQVKVIASIVHQYEGVITKGCQEVRKRTETTNSEIDSIALGEHKRHYEVFRRYYLTLGELVYKKEKRNEEIERFIRSIDLQISISADTLDPYVQRHKEFRKELERTKQNCKVKLDMLRENGAKAAEEFKQTETALQQAGMKIVSPLIELQEQNLDRRTQLLQKLRTVVEQDRADIDLESSGIEELTQRAKQARLAGRPHLLPPLSPSPPPSKWKH